MSRNIINTGPQGKEISPGIFEKFLHPGGWLRDKVVLRSQPGPGGSDAVHVTVNGYTMGIPRDVEVDLPRPFVDALRNAVMDEIVEDPVTKEETVKHVPRFYFEVRQEGVNMRDIMEAREA
jgi:hypothetical protein